MKKCIYIYISFLFLNIGLRAQDKVSFEFLNKTKFPIEFSLGNAEKPPTTANFKTLEGSKKFAQQVPDSSQKPFQVLFREKNKPDIAFIYEIKAKKGKKLYVRVLEKDNALSFEPQVRVLNNLDKNNIKLIKTVGIQKVHEVDKPTSQMIQRVKSELEQKSQALDMVIVMDEGADIKQAKEFNRLGADGAFIQKLIEQEIPFVMTSNLLKELKQYAEDTYKKLLTNRWTLLGKWVQKYGSINYDYVIALPRNYWSNLSVTNPNDLKYIGLDQKELVSLQQKEIDIILNDPYLYEINLSAFKKIFTNNPFVKKNFYLTGHGNKGSVANLNASVYKEFLEFLNTQSVNILYVQSCYAGGVNLREIYQKEAMDTTPLNLNYFIFVGSVTDSVTWAETAKMDFKKFFDAVHAFFSPEGPKMKKPLEAIGEALWGKWLENIPSLRFPGSVNYFKALNVDNTAEIITYAKTRAAELEAKIATEKKLVSTKEGITIGKDKKAVLVYPPVIKAPIKTIAGITDFQIISMIPGNAIHYFDAFDANLAIPDALNLAFIGVKGIREYFTARKLFFVKNLPTTFPTKGKNYMMYIDGPNKTLTQVHLETNENKPEENGYYITTYKLVDKEYKRESKKVSENEAFDVIRKSIKDVGPWVQPIGDEYPETLIEAALQEK